MLKNADLAQTEASMRANITGLIVAGGHSSRFGGEKALAKLGGHSLLEQAAEALNPWVSDIAVSARAESATEAAARSLGFCAVSDRPGLAKGPLAGILAGLEWSERLGAQWMASLPCDVVAIPQDAFSRLLAAADRAKAAYAVTPDGPQSLCAIWPVEGRSMLEADLTSGTHPAVHHILDLMSAKPVPFEGANIFLNINTKTDLLAAEKALSR